MPRLSKNYFLNFYGGEPLLSFDLIKRVLVFLKKKNREFGKKGNYSITTNGSLFTEEIIQLFNRYKFSVELSFDGFAQDLQRKKGSFQRIVSAVEELLNYPGINLEINSVFTQETLSCISESIQFLIGLGVNSINLSLSTLEPWRRASLQELKKEMMKLRALLISHYKKTKNIPLVNFRENHGNGFFYCAAGTDRLAIAPGGEVWGCCFFYDYFKRKESSFEHEKFFFGDLDDFINNYKKSYPRIHKNYSKLSMDNFSSSQMECFLCSELEKCAVCPVNAAFASDALGKIPRYLCKIKKISIQQKEEFRESLKKC